MSTRDPGKHIVALHTLSIFDTTSVQMELHDENKNDDEAHPAGCCRTGSTEAPCWQPIPRRCMLASNTRTRSQSNVAADLLAR